LTDPGDLAGLAIAASTFMKSAAGLIGMVAAVLWYRSASAPDQHRASQWNKRAAIATGLSVLIQAASSCIDALAPPYASWAPG
jgi:hypothetical protein